MAMKKVNEEAPTRKHRLKSLWHRLGLKKGIGAFTDYEDDADKDFMWRRYIIDETMTRSIFRGVDRVRLTDIMLGTLIRNK
jgi:hypothetical protein